MFKLADLRFLCNGDVVEALGCSLFNVDEGLRLSFRRSEDEKDRFAGPMVERRCAELMFKKVVLLGFSV